MSNTTTAAAAPSSFGPAFVWNWQDFAACASTPALRAKIRELESEVCQLPDGSDERARLQGRLDVLCRGLGRRGED